MVVREQSTNSSPGLVSCARKSQKYGVITNGNKLSCETVTNLNQTL